MEIKGDRDAVREGELRLQLALNGDQEALGRLLASYMPQLHRAVLHVLGTSQDAEDALQDGFVQVVQHVREFEGRSRFSTWVTSIVINAALMRLRKSRRESLISLDQKLDRVDLTLADSLNDPGPNPEEAFVWKERLQLLGQKLQNMPAAHRAALWLRGVEGLSTKEAAEILGINVATLKSQFHRARLSLGKDSARAWDGAAARRKVACTAF